MAVLAVPAARQIAQGRFAIEKLRVQQVPAMKTAKMMAVRPGRAALFLAGRPDFRTRAP